MLLPLVLVAMTKLVHFSHAQMLTLDRNILDTIHDIRCWSMSRTTGTSTDCTCKPEYGTVMAPEGSTWDCTTPAEAKCDYAFGEAGKVYPITKSTDSVPIVPAISSSGITKVELYNFRSKKGGIFDSTFWDDVTNEAVNCFRIEEGGKRLSFYGLNLGAWTGHVIKIGLGGGKCAFAKLSGRATYPLKLDEFKAKKLCKQPTTTPKSTTTIVTTTTPTTTPITTATPPEKLRVARAERDTMHSKRCHSKTRTTGSSTVCTCKPDYSTAMSEEGKEWDCFTPSEVGCKYNVYGGSNAFLVRKGDNVLDITPTIKGEHRYIKNILVWSADLNGIGSWHDVTADAKSFFILDPHAHALKISDMELEKWQGHVVRVTLGDDKCIVVKVVGNIVHPVEIAAFKKAIGTTTSSSTSSSKGIDSVTKTSYKMSNGVKTTITTTTTTETSITTTVDIKAVRTPVNDEL